MGYETGPRLYFLNYSLFASQLLADMLVPREGSSTAVPSHRAMASAGTPAPPEHLASPSPGTSSGRTSSVRARALGVAGEEGELGQEQEPAPRGAGLVEEQEGPGEEEVVVGEEAHQQERSCATAADPRSSEPP